MPDAIMVSPATFKYYFRRKHEDLIRDGQDLIYNLLLTIPQATLGDAVEIPTIDGKARIKITPGTQPGTTLRLRGKGLPAVRGYGYGRWRHCS